MRTKFTPSARKHKVGNTYAAEVMAGIPTLGTRSSGEPELTWVGVDSRGRELEVIAVLTPDSHGNPMTLVIHVMPTALRRS